MRKTPSELTLKIKLCVLDDQTMNLRNLKKLVRLIIPAGIIEIYRAHRQNLSYWGYTWEGVYQDWTDVPTAGEGYNSDTWINKNRESMLKELDTFKQSRAISAPAAAERSLLPLLVSLLCKSEKVTVLDFGGGMGVDYLHLLSRSVDCEFIDYHIVDTEKSCEVGRRIFDKDSRIHFYGSLPSSLTELDIVYSNGRLQYVENFKGLLTSLHAYQPHFFLFVHLDAGEIPTHARGQKVSNSTIPCWFFNLAEITNIMATSGYSLIYRELGHRIYDESNLPKQYRLKRQCNLLFRRNVENKEYA